MSTHNFERCGSGEVNGFTRRHGATESLVLAMHGHANCRRKAQSDIGETQRELIGMNVFLRDSVAPCESFHTGHMPGVGGVS